MAIIGAAIGIAASLALSRFIESQLYEVGTHDPLVLLGAVLLLLFIATISSYIPAKRAAYADPITGLRHE